MANSDDKKCTCDALQSDDPGPEGSGTMDDGGYICGSCWQVAAFSATPSPGPPEVTRNLDPNIAPTNEPGHIDDPVGYAAALERGAIAEIDMVG